MDVVILAGGLGTRLRSVVSEVPKCMAPVAGNPFLWYLLKYLNRYDVSRVVLSVGYLRETIFSWIEEIRSTVPFEIDFAVEESPLGTGGGIKLAVEKCLSDSVVVLNGDTFFDVDLQQLCRLHESAGRDITMALKPMKNFDRYGSVNFDKKSSTVVSFNEKKYCEQGLINGGVYVISKKSKIFFGMPLKFSFEMAVLECQCSLGNVAGLEQNGYFIDIGVPEDYRKADLEFRNLF